MLPHILVLPTTVPALPSMTVMRMGSIMNRAAVSLEERMREIRTVNRAKWLLISERGMSEAEAHRWIEKQAMDRCISKREVADEIIKTYS